MPRVWSFSQRAPCPCLCGNCHLYFLFLSTEDHCKATGQHCVDNQTFIQPWLSQYPTSSHLYQRCKWERGILHMYSQCTCICIKDYRLRGVREIRYQFEFLSCSFWIFKSSDWSDTNIRNFARHIAKQRNNNNYINDHIIHQNTILKLDQFSSLIRHFYTFYWKTFRTRNIWLNYAEMWGKIQLWIEFF